MAPITLSPIFILSTIIVLAHGLLDEDLIKILISEGKSDVLVHFSGANSQVIENIESKSFLNRLTKVEELCTNLQSLADHTQSPVIKFLQGFGVDFQTFWASNQLVIRKANLLVLLGVNAFPQVSRRQVLPVIKLSPLQSSIKPQVDTTTTVQWGVAKIKADQVWSKYKTNGENVVVANIDSGVRWTHEALFPNWRADHAWYDPYTSTTFPDDNNGHGTHTMGTIAGQGGIGVAPGAQWIACRGCNGDSCDGAKLNSCGEWMLKPTNPDGSDPDSLMIPDVISNSWGSSIGNDGWYNPTLNAWKAAGILNAFAIGNSGPFCGTGGSPGDQPAAFSVGSTDVNDRLSGFSSKGRAGVPQSTYSKPEIAAPGSDVVSAWNTGDTDYNTISGTSMATPHVAGTMALMISAYRLKTGNNAAKLSFVDTAGHIQKSTDTQNLTVAPITNMRCDGLFPNTTKYPNNEFGYGRINAVKAVASVLTGLSQKNTNTATNVGLLQRITNSILGAL